MMPNISSFKTYQHNKLPSSTLFRLTTLIAGAWSDDLQCEIDTIEIDENLAYEAVSYVWGPLEDRSSIQVLCRDDTSELEIPRNLASALRRFRDLSSNRILWVDSICINQDDDDERSQQVRLMGQIYRRASTVLVWLGEDVENGKTEQACNCMNILNHARPKLKELQVNKFSGLPENTTQINSFFGIARGSSDDTCHDLGIPLLHSPDFDALIDLLKNPWFSRAWTWQESFLAKRRKFFRGSWSWSDKLLVSVCFVLIELNTFFSDDTYLTDGYKKVLPMIAGQDFWTRRDESDRTKLELQVLLPLRRGSGCKYPSDLLYSLLGAAWESPNIQVDYKQPFEAVFARFTWQMMVKRGSLSILSQVEKDREPSTLPTWVPDWRVSGNTTGLLSSSQKGVRYAATGSSKPVVRLSEDVKVLTVAGLDWDRVSDVNSGHFEGIDDWVNEKFTTTVDGKRIYSHTDEPIERALRRVSYLDKTDFTNECETTRWKPDSHEKFQEIVEQALSSGQKGRLRYSVLINSMVQARKSRVILVTEGSRLGMASDNVLPGDMIAMLLGGEAPIVLRPLKETGQYTYVAECYIHGFMDGECLADARWSTQSESDSTNMSCSNDLDVNDLPFSVQEFHIH